MSPSPRVTLAADSEYEQLFRVRHRAAGRPDPVNGDEEPLFPAGENHPLLVDVARRRAYAVLHEESRDRLRELYKSELKVLRRRGVAAVAGDVGRSIEPSEEAEPVREAVSA